MTHLNLPDPIAAYFDAEKHGSDTLDRCFLHQAVVIDEGQTYTGLPAITAWKSSASARYDVSAP
ncbi:MAG: hypothetical protein ACFHX7_12315 [Pseudomonadota bacterium]